MENEGSTRRDALKQLGMGLGVGAVAVAARQGRARRPPRHLRIPPRRRIARDA